MLRTSTHRILLKRPVRFHSTSSPQSPSLSLGGALKTATALGLVTAVLYSQTLGTPVKLEAEKGKASGFEDGRGREQAPEVFLWGRNTSRVAAPTSSSSSVKRPSPVSALSTLVLRDLALSATYAVAVDSSGDVLQWGHGYGGPEGGVEKSVVGLDLVAVKPTEQGKVFGLSRNGEVYVWASDKIRQTAGAVSAATTNGGGSWSSFFWPWGASARDSSVEVLKVKPNAQLARGEHFVSLSSGEHHLTALTSTGRAFALPLSLSANTFGQLGVRSVELLSPPHPGSSPASGLSVRLDPDERLNEPRDLIPPQPKNLDPLLLNSRTLPTPADPSPKGDVIPAFPSSLTAKPVAVELHPSPSEHTALEKSPHFCTILHEIPSLKGVQIVELVAGKRHTLARLGGRMEGRVLGWGANSYGQLGLGAALSYPSIPTPTEIPLSSSPSYAFGGSSSRPSSVKCERIAAGGNVSYFVVGTESVGGASQDLLASGQGQFGSIGNGLFAHATSPLRVKSISGLSEWNERSGKVETINIRDIQAGDGHVAVVLDNAVAHPSGATFGRDTLVWGYNEFYQLGTGKRSNLAVPSRLDALPSAKNARGTTVADGSDSDSGKAVNRLQLAANRPASPALLAANRGLKRKSIVEEVIVAGDGGTGVYWRVLNP